VLELRICGGLVVVDDRILGWGEGGFGIADSGAEYEMVFCCVTTFDDGAIFRMEYFDVGERDAAIARLHELGRPGSS
jgi:hypothetical protein